MIVYLVTNLANGKRYVGKTKRTLTRRWYEHVYHANAMDTKMILYSAIRKHGPEGFEKTILSEVFALVGDEKWAVDALNREEKRWIADLKPEYNGTEGGDGLQGYKHTAVTKARMSASRTGKKMSAAARANMSAGQMGHAVSEQTREKHRLAKLGTKRSLEDRRKISEGQYVRVVQSDLDGNPLATYLSLIDAQMITGIKFQNISRACRFSHRTAGGFKWRYENQKD